MRIHTHSNTYTRRNEKILTPTRWSPAATPKGIILTTSSVLSAKALLHIKYESHQRHVSCGYTWLYWKSWVPHHVYCGQYMKICTWNTKECDIWLKWINAMTRMVGFICGKYQQHNQIYTCTITHKWCIIRRLLEKPWAYRAGGFDGLCAYKINSDHKKVFVTYRSNNYVHFSIVAVLICNLTLYCVSAQWNVSLQHEWA